MGVEDINYIEIKNCIVENFMVRQLTSGIDISHNLDTTWQFDTYLLCKFQGNLNAGNLDMGGLTITDWRIRRRRLDSTAFIDISTIKPSEDNDLYYMDYTPASGVPYEYEITPISNGIYGQPAFIQVTCTFDYWWITDNTYNFPLFANLEIADIQTNIKRNVYETFSEFPTIVYGKQKYKSGEITTILMDANGNMSKSYRDTFEDFINNKKYKYMKNPQGDIFVVDTYTPKRSIINGIINNGNNSINDISQYTFAWQEVKSSENL